MEPDETPHECPCPISVRDESPAPARRHGDDLERAYPTSLFAKWPAWEVRDMEHDPRQDSPQERRQADKDTGPEGPDVDDEPKASSPIGTPAPPDVPATIETDRPVWERVDGRGPRRPPALTVTRQPAASPRSWGR